MSANALEMMVVPIVRGLFLVVMVGAAGRGLFRMCTVVAGAWLPDRPAGSATPDRPARGRVASDIERKLAEDDLVAVVA